jgi:four helix bundle protein
MKMGMGLEDLEVLRLAEMVADEIWRQVSKWQSFPQDTVGKQLTRSVDSIGANIAESFGRFHFGEKIRFLYYARGSLFETKYWLNRCAKRALLPKTIIDEYAARLTNIARQLNGFARHLKSQKRHPDSTTIRESQAEYEVDPSLIFTTDDLVYPLFTEDDLAWLSQTAPEPESSIINH